MDFSAKKAALIFSLIAAPAFIFAEDFRVHKNHSITLGIQEKQTVTMAKNDSLSIYLPQDKSFIQGIELSIKVPKVVADWRDSIAWSIYKNISPAPTQDRIDYSGERFTVGTFGSSVSYTIKIPLEKANTIKKDSYSNMVDFLPLNKDNFVFFRLQLAMKGSDEAIDIALFEVSIKPILKDKGRLVFKLTENGRGISADTDDFTIVIDNNPVQVQNNSVILDRGIHNIAIMSSSYRNEMRSVTIDQAKNSILEIELRDITPLLRIIAPNGTETYLDDKKIDFSDSLKPMEPGEHTVKFKFGGYEITKTLSCENGKTYTMSLNMDVVLSEEN